MAEAPVTPRLENPPTAGELVTQNNLERELLRAMRQLDFRPGRERILVVRWNGVRLLVMDTEQV